MYMYIFSEAAASSEQISPARAGVALPPPDMLFVSLFVLMYFQIFVSLLFSFNKYIMISIYIYDYYYYTYVCMYACVYI